MQINKLYRKITISEHSEIIYIPLLIFIYIRMLTTVNC